MSFSMKKSKIILWSFIVLYFIFTIFAYFVFEKDWREFENTVKNQRIELMKEICWYEKDSWEAQAMWIGNFQYLEISWKMFNDWIISCINTKDENSQENQNLWKSNLEYCESYAIDKAVSIAKSNCNNKTCLVYNAVQGECTKYSEASYNWITCMEANNGKYLLSDYNSSFNICIENL